MRTVSLLAPQPPFHDNNKDVAPMNLAASIRAARFPLSLVFPALPLVLVLGQAGCAPSAETDQTPGRKYVGARSAADGNVLPFSGAVWVGNTLYLSGQLGLENGQAPETAEAEAANALDNMKTLLENAGLTMDDLVAVQVFASDVGDYQVFNDVYRTYFTREYPARAFIGSGTLLFGARFEVQGVAARPRPPLRKFPRRRGGNAEPLDGANATRGGAGCPLRRLGREPEAAALSRPSLEP